MENTRAKGIKLNIGATKSGRKFKFSGLVEPNSLLHYSQTEAPDGAMIPPTYVFTEWPNNNLIPQYAPTIKGTFNGYNPAGDCNGYFMPYLYQTNNNCYAYATLICSNTFPQPGRNSPGSVPFEQEFSAHAVMTNAVLDGLEYVGECIDDIRDHNELKGLVGHYVALMFSEPESNIGGDSNANWPGDYHWVRCDDNVNFSSWSQKNGSNQVTNFDFAGNPITDPATANWRVNQGHFGNSADKEFIVNYNFYCFMFVPIKGVNII